MRYYWLSRYVRSRGMRDAMTDRVATAMYKNIHGDVIK